MEKHSTSYSMGGSMQTIEVHNGCIEIGLGEQSKALGYCLIASTLCYHFGLCQLRLS